MSLSARFSGRAADDPTNHLARAGDTANERADGNRPGSSSRVGRRQLARLRSSLSDRDVAVLRSLAVLHYASTRQVERLHFRGTGMTSLAASRGARRTLAHLHNLELVDRLDRRIGGVRAGSAGYVLRLSPAGARLMGDTNRRRSREPGLAHLAHVLDVAELVVRLHEHARTDAVELVAIETEPACWRPFVGLHGSRVLLKPDLRLTLAVGPHELHWFVEVDRGSEHRPALGRKISTYLAAWRDGGEQARAGVFPRVLWVAPDQRRVDVIRRVCNTTNGVPAGMFVVALTDDAAVDALMAAGGAS
jgi:Replication-relaxation